MLMAVIMLDKIEIKVCIYVTSQHSVHMLIGPVLQQQYQSYKTQHKLAIPTGQPHFDLVLIIHSRPITISRTYNWFQELASF